MATTLKDAVDISDYDQMANHVVWLSWELIAQQIQDGIENAEVE